ncbi:MAG: hypothetical protein HC780_28985 [Leptolyngbyaceae cyanobacterium CSU_1_3]|nr:hypothetical protein [Leptolyngbyaceae cyanobacterium CSU_1_3]
MTKKRRRLTYDSGMSRWICVDRTFCQFPEWMRSISLQNYTLSGHKIKDFGRGAGGMTGWGRSPHTPSKPKSIG